MSEPLTRRRAVSAAVASASYAIRRAWAWTPGWLVRLVVTQLVQALSPAAQVLAVGWLVRSVPDGPLRFVPPLLALTVIVGLNQILGSSFHLVGQRIGIRLQTRYQSELIHCVARLTPQQLADTQVNATVQSCRDALFSIGRMVPTVLSAAAALVTAASLCVTVWAISPLAGLLVMVALVPFLLVYAWEAQMQEAAFVPLGERTRRVGYHIEQLIGQRTGSELATLGSNHRVADRADDHQRQADRITDRILVLLIRADVIGGATSAVILGAALTGIVVGGAGGAGIAAGVVGVLSGISATRGAGFAYGDLMSVSPKISAYRRFVDTVPAASVTAPATGVALLEAEHLVVAYPGRETPAVDGVSLRAGLGEMVALVGVNGAGKTSAVNALIGVVDLAGGQVRIDGDDLSGLTLPERLARFGLLTQEFGRYEFTVRETVLLGTPESDVGDDRVWAALDSANAGDLVRSLPDGLDTQLGSQFGGVGLSGGQWQRLALARIYLRNAAVWVLDEPTSAIDAEAEQQVFAELTRTKHDRITIVVSHRAWTLRAMDRIYVFDHGRVIEQGRYDDLLASCGRFAEIFAEQAT